MAFNKVLKVKPPTLEPRTNVSELTLKKVKPLPKYGKTFPSLKREKKKRSYNTLQSRLLNIYMRSL